MRTTSGRCPHCHQDVEIQFDGLLPEPRAVVACDHCGRESRLGRYQKTKKRDARREREAAVDAEVAKRRRSAKDVSAARKAVEKEADWQRREELHEEMRRAADYEIPISAGVIFGIFLCIAAMLYSAKSPFGGVSFAVLFAGLLITDHVRENTRAVHKLRKSVDDAIKSRQDGE